MSIVFIDKNTKAEADAVARIWRIRFGDTYDVTVKEMGNKFRVTRTPKAAVATLAPTAVAAASPMRLIDNDTAHPSTTTSNLKPLLDLIGNAETNDHYNAIYGDEESTNPNLLTMNVDEVIVFQLGFLRRGSPSSACGRYQILRGTLKDLKRRLGMTGIELFDTIGQDKLAIALLQRRGLDSYLAGTISRDRFVDNLAMEWAAIPNMTGKSHYDGDGLNSARVSLADVISVVEALKWSRLSSAKIFNPFFQQ